MGLALEEGPVAREGLALRGGEAVVLPEVDGRRDHAVDRATGEEEGVQRRQDGGPREDAERPHGIVHDRRPAVMAVVGQEPVRGLRIVGLEVVLRQAPDDRIGMRAE